MSSPGQHRSSHKAQQRSRYHGQHAVHIPPSHHSPRVPHRSGRSTNDDYDDKEHAEGHHSQQFHSPKTHQHPSRGSHQGTPRNKGSRIALDSQRYTQSPAMSSSARQTRSQPMLFPSANYEHHISKEAAAEGVKRKQLIQGRLRVNQKKASEAYVAGGEFSRNDILISGLEHRNRALDGDLVVVQPLPASDWVVLQQDLLADRYHLSLFGASASNADELVSPSALSPASEPQTAEASLVEAMGELTVIGNPANDVHVVLLEGLPEDATQDEIREVLRDVKLVDFKLVTQCEQAFVLVFLILIFSNRQDCTDGFVRLQLRKVRTHEVRPSYPTMETLLSIVKQQLPPKYIRPTAKVVYVSTETRETKLIVGTLQFLKPEAEQVDPNRAVLNPSDPRMPLVAVASPPEFRVNPKAFMTQLVGAVITDWPATQLHPNGHITKMIGQLGDILAETEAILFANNIPTDEIAEKYCDDLPRSTPENPWVIPADEIARRRDCRNVLVCTIDPPTARDLDDALSCTQLENGNYEIIVHIADVSHFLHAGTALDEHARARATTTYLVQQCYPMLPRLLSEQLCSLNPGEDRCTFSIGWEMTPDADIVSEWASKSVIHSHARLTYDHAQRIIENPDLDWDETMPAVRAPYASMDVIEAITSMQALAQKLRARRFANGALRIENVKMTFKLDADGNPIDCKPYIIRDANRLVEEFMLLANMAAARRIYTAFPDCALLRRHEPPNEKKLDQAMTTLNKNGYNIDTSSSLAIQTSLNHILQTRPKSDFYVVQHLLTLPMQTAKYFCTSEKELPEFRHYALAVPYYTHFTSPIRRYADVIVHRLLACSLSGEAFGLSGKAVEHIADTCNLRKAAAKRASEESSSLFLWAYMANKGSLKEDAVVLGVMDYSFDVLITRLGLHLRINLQLQNQELSFRTSQGKLIVTWNASKQQQAIGLGTLLMINLLPYRRDIRPDVQGRLVEPAERSPGTPQVFAETEDQTDDEDDDTVEAHLGLDEVE